MPVRLSWIPFLWRLPIRQAVCVPSTTAGSAGGKAGRSAAAYLGKTAVVSFGNIVVVLCYRAAASGDPQILHHFGVEPTLSDLAVKANTSFREPYSTVSDMVYFDDTRAGASNLRAMKWERLPDSLYPFTEMSCPKKAEIW